jgi:hypothetical protein
VGKATDQVGEPALARCASCASVSAESIPSWFRALHVAPPAAFFPTPNGTPFRTLWTLDGVSRNRIANARPSLEIELRAKRTGHVLFRLSDWHLRACGPDVKCNTQSSNNERAMGRKR